MTLEELRSKIDILDDQLLALLNQRMFWVQKVGELKHQTQAPIYRPEREKQIIDRICEQNSGPLNKAAIEAIFIEIFAVARNIEKPEKVAYLGPQGSFTHQAAESRFGAMSEYFHLPTIQSVFEAVATGRVRFGVIPIENNQEGIVFETVDLLNEKEVSIVSELKIPVHFSLATFSENLLGIKKIYSKDIAFRQCRGFLSKYFEGNEPEEIQVESTSKAAKLAAADPYAAAICSDIAAKLLQIPILFSNIEDNSNNQTRFYILAKDHINQPSNSDKTTFIARLPHTDRAGVLASFLQDFKVESINLTKIESRPYKGDEYFNFWFFVEMEGNQTSEGFKRILEKHGSYIKILGSYAKNV